MTDNYFLIGYHDGDQVRLALQINEQTFRLAEPWSNVDWLLTNGRISQLISSLREHKGEAINLTAEQYAVPAHQQEVWAAGVTYKRSEEARERESGNSRLYTQVYMAQRPEIFMKAVAWDAIAHGQEVGIRRDATWSVPEPELTVVLNAHQEVIGFTIGNDMSSRDIEGENPLYLPQAKVYDAACAIGPRIWLQPGCQSWPDLTIGIAIWREGEAVFEGETSTQQIKRPLLELVDYLGRCKTFAYGAFLMSGTGIVPPDDFTLLAGDEVQIHIAPIGILANRVKIVG